MHQSRENYQVGKRYVLGIDVGTTNIRCYAYDDFSNVVGKAEDKIELEIVDEYGVEIQPENLWKTFVGVVNNCLKDAKLDPDNVDTLGISTQRGTFLTWDEKTGKPYHNFITWKDVRAESYCSAWNSALSTKFFKMGAHILYLITRNKQFQVVSSLKFSTAMVIMRLLWVLDQFPEIRESCNQKRTLFGTIDTWLVWKLTGGEVHATDSSNACVTGFFDMFKLEWAQWTFKTFKIPSIILPEVKNTSDSYGNTLPDIFGASISINAVVGDQQASMFGACCFEYGDVNCTMGTGSFLKVNTGSLITAAHHGVYPLVGWTLNSETTYIAECGAGETGNIISWAQKLGLFNHPSESNNIAESVTDSDGVLFLPSLNMLETPKSSAFVGLRVHTTKEHMVRSVLEALVFQICMMYDLVTQESYRFGKPNIFRICGGVSKNDFIVQLISDITSRSVHRLKHVETSSLGAAYLAGLHSGVWKSLDEISCLSRKIENFVPNKISQQKYYKLLRNWSKALLHTSSLCKD